MVQTVILPRSVRLAPAKRRSRPPPPSRQDLLAAADWCRGYASAETDPETVAIHRVAAWLEALAERTEV